MAPNTLSLFLVQRIPRLQPRQFRMNPTRTEASFFLFEKPVVDHLLTVPLVMGDGRKLSVSLDNHTNRRYLAAIRRHISSRYSEQKKIMSLNSFTERLQGVAPAFCDFNDPEFATTLIRALKLHRDSVEILLLENNNIKTLRLIRDLPKVLPNLRKLDLNTNGISFFFIFSSILYYPLTISRKHIRV